jgi:hypothetical protein
MKFDGTVNGRWTSAPVDVSKRRTRLISVASTPVFYIPPLPQNSRRWRDLLCNDERIKILTPPLFHATQLIKLIIFNCINPIIDKN